MVDNAAPRATLAEFGQYPWREGEPRWFYQSYRSPLDPSHADRAAGFHRLATTAAKATTLGGRKYGMLTGGWGTALRVTTNPAACATPRETAAPARSAPRSRTRTAA